MRPNHTPMFPQQFVKRWSNCFKSCTTCNSPIYMSNDAITFSARFGGVAREIYVPIRAVLGVYARENGWTNL